MCSNEKMKVFEGIQGKKYSLSEKNIDNILQRNNNRKEYLILN